MLLLYGVRSSYTRKSVSTEGFPICIMHENQDASTNQTRSTIPQLLLV